MERAAGVRRDGAAADGAAGLRLSGVPDEGLVPCPVRLRLQSADRLCGLALLRACAVLRLGGLSLGTPRQGGTAQLSVLGRRVAMDRHSAAAVAAGAGDPGRHRDGRSAWT